MPVVQTSTIDIVGDLKGITIIRNTVGLGSAITFPRSYLDKARGIEEFACIGVYVIWRAYQVGSLPRAYIGHSENVMKRLNDHKSKDFWTHAIGFVDKDNWLTDHANYLETVLYELAKGQERCLLDNATAPGKNLAERHRQRADAHLPHILACLKLVGADFFEERLENRMPSHSISVPSLEPELYDRESPLLYLTPRVADAKGYLMKDRSFVVLSGSQMSKTERSALKLYYPKAHKRREELIAQKKVVEDTETTYKFLSDYTFEPDEKRGTAVSFATGVLIGRNPNAPDQWKDAQGKKLREYLPAQS